jgi:hypothetical protein
VMAVDHGAPCAVWPAPGPSWTLVTTTTDPGRQSATW